MKLVKYLALTLAVICAAAFLYGCSDDNNSSGGKEIEMFLADGVGEWYRCGDRNGELLTITEDGAWEVTSHDGAVTAKGKLAMSEFDKGVVQFENEMSNKMYQAIPVKDGSRLNFDGYIFVRKDYAAYGLDQFDGSWYVDGDRDNDYYTFEGGEWKFYEAQGSGHVSTESGLLVFDGGNLLAVARRTSDEDAPFAELTYGDNELTGGGKTYVLLEDIEYTADSDAYTNEDGYIDDDHIDEYIASEFGGSAEHEVTTGIFYYRQGNWELDSLYFYDDGTVDLDSPGQETVEATYSVSGSVLTITFGGNDWLYDISYDGSVQILTDEYGNQYPSVYE
jgi:hypothetical protein